MNTDRKNAEPRVAVCLYDLALWLMRRTNRFARKA